MLLLRDIRKGHFAVLSELHEVNPRVLTVLPPMAGKGVAECRTSTPVVLMPRALPLAKDPNPRDLHQAEL